MIRYLITLLLCFTSAVTQANSAFNRSTLGKLIVHDYGTAILLVTATPISNSEGCPDNSYMALLKTHPSFKEMYAAAMSAYLTGAAFEGWVNGCSSFGAPIVTRLDLIR